MKTILNYLGILLIGIIIGIVCSIVVRSKLTTPIRKVITDTTTVVKYDTIRTTEPFSELAIPVKIKRFATVPTLLTISDTIKVPYYIKDTLMIPIEQRYYTGESYKAWVSGYLPKLDSITILSQSKTVTIEKFKNARNQLYLSAQLNYIHPFPAMSIGVQAGFNRDRWGLSIGTGGIVTPSGLKWYGQVGLEYDLFIKKW